jgi:hypothetical protein
MAAEVADVLRRKMAGDLPDATDFIISRVTDAFEAMRP